MASRTSTDPIEILLEMGVDLDNLSMEEDYLSALIEATNALTITNPSDPRITILQQEILKVRKKRKAGPKINVRKTKITANNVRTIKNKVKPPKALPTSALVPYQKPEAEEEKEQKKRRTTSAKAPNLLENIAKNVSDIAGILQQQYKQKQNAASSDRKKAEQANRNLKESNLEKSVGILGKTAEKMIAPVKSLLEKIFDFFLNILIGRFLVKFIDWFGKEENQKKVSSLIRFFKDHGLKLLAAYLLFGTSIGRFATRFAVSLVKGSVRLLKATAKFAKANPLAAAAIGVGALGAAAIAQNQKGTAVVKDPENPDKSQMDDTRDFGGMTGSPMGGLFSGGGKVNGAKGTDKIPAMLTDGEFVMSKGAVQKYGVDTLEAMNAAGGGTNQPKVVGNKVYASVGGYVGGQRAKRHLGKRGTPDPNGEKKSSSPSIPSSAIKPRQVLALKNGIQGKLNPVTGKFTPKAFTEAERARYIKFGGKIPESPKKPERSEFPMGRSGAKKYQEAMQSFKAAADSVVKASDQSAAAANVTAQASDQSAAAANVTAQASKRHSELMQSTSPQKIADYDAKHGAGAYSKKLQEKLNKIYSSQQPQSQPQSKIVPTGRVVGRENLSPEAQKALARLDAQKAGGQTSDMQYTRNGKKISAEQFNKVKSGDIIPGGGKPGGLFGGMFGGMGKPPAPAPGQKVVDGNIGKPTAQEQRDIDALAAKKEKLKQSQQKLMGMNSPEKSSQGDAALRAEYDMIQNDPHHPLFEKVRGGSDLDDFGMRFSDFKKFKAQQSQVKLKTTPPKTTPPPPPQEPKVNVVSTPAPQGGDSSADGGGGGGSNIDAQPTGNGNENKFKIFGVSMPF